MLLALTAFLNHLLLVPFPTDFQSQQISNDFIKRQIQQYQIHGNSFAWSAMVDRLKKGVWAMFWSKFNTLYKEHFLKLLKGAFKS